MKWLYIARIGTMEWFNDISFFNPWHDKYFRRCENSLYKDVQELNRNF